jgi:hypothetical protein
LSEVRDGLVDWLAGEPTSREASDLRHAADEAVGKLLDEADDLDAIVLDDAGSADLMETFLAAWLTRAIVRDLGKALTEGPAVETAQRIAEIREFVAARLASLLDGRPISRMDWVGTSGDQIAAQTIGEALAIFGDAEPGSGA